MYCPKCGAHLDGGARFCSGCGTNISGDPAPVQPAQSPARGVPPQQAYAPYPGAPQSAGYPGAPAPAGVSKPANYLPWSIFCTLCCCIIGGIIGIIYSVQANKKWEQGDWAGAQKDASTARTWLIVSTIVGVIFGVIGLITKLATILSMI